MIIPVTDDNEITWATLCAELWCDCDQKEFLQTRHAGECPFEFLYMKEQETLAFMSLSLRRDYVEGTDTSPVAYVEGLYVRPAYRRLGIATEMIQFAKSWAGARHCQELASDCPVDNALSELFHKHVGFQEVSRNIHFVMKMRDHRASHGIV